MRQLFLTLLLGISIYTVCAQPAQAQTATSNPDNNTQFYLFVSHGVISDVRFGEVTRVDPYRSFQFGGAAELFWRKGLAFGAELAASPKPIKSKPVTLTYRTLSGSEATATYAASGVKGWGSLNLSYHFKELSASGRLAPFVTAGGTIFARDGLAEAINYGAGISFWKNRHRGWRLEYRKHVVEEGAFISRLRSVRIGLVFR